MDSRCPCDFGRLRGMTIENENEGGNWGGRRAAEAWVGPGALANVGSRFRQRKGVIHTFCNVIFGGEAQEFLRIRINHSKSNKPMGTGGRLRCELSGRQRASGDTVVLISFFGHGFENEKDLKSEALIGQEWTAGRPQKGPSSKFQAPETLQISTSKAWKNPPSRQWAVQSDGTEVAVFRCFMEGLLAVFSDGRGAVLERDVQGEEVGQGVQGEKSGAILNGSCCNSSKLC